MTGQVDWQTVAARILTDDHRFDSLLVLRDDATLLEAYRFPYGPPGPNDPGLHDLRSAAKSVVALLAGIAIDRGVLAGVEQPVLPLFADYDIAHLDEQKQAITARDLLTMRSGLDLTDPMTGDMIGSADWAGYVLDRPMRAAPGTRFEYATGNVHLLSAAIGRAAGMSTRQFAAQYLFEPLGITDTYWWEDPQGVAVGGMGLYLTPRDMAKLGQLVLAGGTWQGERVISADWLRACLTPGDTSGTSPHYGYLWWVYDAGDGTSYYAAHGYAGQYIVVLPAYDAVVVLTGVLKPDQMGLAERLLTAEIVPVLARSAARATADSPTEAARPLIVGRPEPAPVPPLPEVARRVSGRVIRLEPNAFALASLTLTFTPGADEATVAFNDGPPLPIGLDGVWRVTPAASMSPWVPLPMPVALRGAWSHESTSARNATFALAYQEIGVPEDQDFAISFGEDTVQIVAVETLTGETEHLVGNYEF